MLGDVILESGTDESLNEVFLHLLSSNCALEKTIQVIQTPLMETLYETIVSKVGRNNSRSILIVGPPSSGKSTTALWLYRQLLHNNQKVKAILFSGASRQVQVEQNLIVICDCNLLKTCRLDDLKDLLRLKVKLSTKGGVLVIAASALLEVLTFENSALSSLIRNITSGMERVSTSGFDEDQAKRFITRISPRTTDDAVVEKLIQDSCKVPGLLRDCIIQQDNVVAVRDHLTQHLCEILPHVPEYQYRATLRLLTCVLHGLPLSSFELEDRASQLCLVKGNFVVMNGNLPPQLYVSAPRSMVMDIIVTFNQHYKRVFATDEESVLGYLFEGVISNSLQNIELMIQKIGETERITVRLNLQFSPARIPQGIKFIGSDVLWQTQKHCFGVDFVAIAARVLEEEDALLLFQISTKKTNHKPKCEPLIPSQVLTLATSEGETSPNTIMYLYINPFFPAEEEYENAYSIFCNHTSRDTSGKTWFFGIPSDQSQVLAVYCEMQSLLY